MADTEINVQDSSAVVRAVLAHISDHIFDPDAVNLSRFYLRRHKDREADKSSRFVIENDIQTEDVRNVMAELTLAEYSTTSKKPGSRDAYVFGVHMPDIVDGDPEIYLKFQIENGFFIVTIHEAERPMNYPYRRCGQ